MDKLSDELSILLNVPLLKESISEEDLVAKLSAIVENWIERDFNHLVEVLYRVDIDERVLKEKLNSGPLENTAEIIARLLLERQKQKLALRNQFHFSKGNIEEDERW
ncbi:hypothetical protein [Arachidicoccus sp.]|jgi:hypothetical protein|uniref:hypothetical protein n=1 Tax=Arachidicoccus sp. TaxID=1872624 RepID=UPI003D1EE975